MYNVQSYGMWHVDDLQISHMDKKVVEDVIKQLNAKFGKECPLTTTRGIVLEYLGMNGASKWQAAM